MENTKKYHYSADVIRAIAIIFVVIIHVSTEFVNTQKYFGNAEWWLANLLDSSIRVAVPLFVMLSGFLILNPEKPLQIGSFLKKRVYRIGLPLLVWPLAYYAWKLYINQGIFTLKTFIADYISINTYYHLYFLYLIAGLYLITPILKSFTDNAPRPWKKYALFITFLFPIIVTASDYWLRTDISLATVFTIFLSFVCYYLFGDYVRQIQLTGKQRTRLLLAYIFLSVITAVANYWSMIYVGWNLSTSGDHAWDRYFYDTLSVTVVPLSLIAFMLLIRIDEFASIFNNRLMNRAIHTISVTSFGIYLIHPFILDVLNKFVFTSNFTFPGPAIIFMFVKIVLIFIISYLITFLMRYIPLLRQLFY